MDWLKHIVGLIALIMVTMAFSSEGKCMEAAEVNVLFPPDSMPIPPLSDNVLFYVQRTPNKNTIVYELNADKNGNVNEDEPVMVYWIRYTENREKADLSYIQQKFAYGINHALVDKESKAFRLNFVSYAKRNISLVRSKMDKKYDAYIVVNNKEIQIDRIFVKIEGGTFWFPTVPYIEIYGKETITGNLVKEVVIP